MHLWGSVHSFVHPTSVVKQRQLDMSPQVADTLSSTARLEIAIVRPATIINTVIRSPIFCLSREFFSLPLQLIRITTFRYSSVNNITVREYCLVENPVLLVINPDSL